VGKSKSYRNGAGSHLDDSTDANKRRDRVVRAMPGFFLSVRPGVQSLLLNVNIATSPFYENMLVSEAIDRLTRTPQVVPRGHGRNLDEVRRVLKGVRVRIEYNTNNDNVTFPNQYSRFRFIQNVGNACSQELLSHPATPDDTVADF
jgi:hypothetical protein